MSPAALDFAGCGFRSQMDRIPKAAFSRGAAPDRTFRIASSVRPNTVPLRSCSGIRSRSHPPIGRQSHRPELRYVSSDESTNPGRNEERYSTRRRDDSTLRCSFFNGEPFPLLHRASVQPFLDEPDDARVTNPVLDELDEPSVIECVEKSTD